jgi:hypothetical protein
MSTKKLPAKPEAARVAEVHASPINGDDCRDSHPPAAPPAPEQSTSDEDADDARLMELSKNLRPSKEDLLKRAQAPQIPEEWWDEESPF